MKKPIIALSILVLLLVEEATGHSIEKKLSQFKKKINLFSYWIIFGNAPTSDKKKVRD
jgi:hypothetical protein